MDPDDPDGPHLPMPDLGLTTVYVAQGQDAGEEFEQHAMQPVETVLRAEQRLSNGDVDGGIRDAADAVDQIATMLEDGAQFIPDDHAAHTTVEVETSRLRHAAERLRRSAADAQQASE